MARFLSAAANEDVLEAAVELTTEEAEAAAAEVGATTADNGAGGAGWAGGGGGVVGVAETGGRLIDEALAEATVVPKATDVTLGTGCLVVVKTGKWWWRILYT